MKVVQFWCSVKFNNLIFLPYKKPPILLTSDDDPQYPPIRLAKILQSQNFNPGN